MTLELNFSKDEDFGILNKTIKRGCDEKTLDEEIKNIINDLRYSDSDNIERLQALSFNLFYEHEIISEAKIKFKYENDDFLDKIKPKWKTNSYFNIKKLF